VITTNKTGTIKIASDVAASIPPNTVQPMVERAMARASGEPGGRAQDRAVPRVDPRGAGDRARADAGRDLGADLRGCNRNGWIAPAAIDPWKCRCIYGEYIRRS